MDFFPSGKMLKVFSWLNINQIVVVDSENSFLFLTDLFQNNFGFVTFLVNFFIHYRSMYPEDALIFKCYTLCNTN